MRKNVFKVWDLPSNSVNAALIIMAIVFLVGGIAGCFFAGRAEGEREIVLSSYLDGFLNVALSDEIIKPAFISMLWKAIRWPLFALFLGLTPVGLIGIPLLILVRSFLLSFSIASFFEIMGAKGLLFAFSALGITGLVYIPILFLFGIRGILNSGLIVGRITGDSRHGVDTKHSNFLCCCVCFLIILICCFVEYSAGAAILKSTAEILS